MFQREQTEQTEDATRLLQDLEKARKKCETRKNTSSQFVLPFAKRFKCVLIFRVNDLETDLLSAVQKHQLNSSTLKFKVGFLPSLLQ